LLLLLVVLREVDHAAALLAALAALLAALASCPWACGGWLLDADDLRKRCNLLSLLSVNSISKARIQGGGTSFFMSCS